MTLIEQAGRPTEAHISYARCLLAALPDSIRRAARETYSARALIYAMLIDRDAEVRQRQLAMIDGFTDKAVAAETRRLLPAVERLDRAARLPVVDLAIGALRRLTAVQYADFAVNLEELIRADAGVSVFEWVLQQVVKRHLQPAFRQSRRQGVKHNGFSAVRGEVSVLLSILGHAGERTAEAAGKALEAGRAIVEGIELIPRKECRLARLEAAVTELSLLAPQLKKIFLKAAWAVITADCRVTVGEAELFRGFADALGVPVPPLLPGGGADIILPEGPEAFRQEA